MLLLVSGAVHIKHEQSGQQRTEWCSLSAATCKTTTLCPSGVVKALLLSSSGYARFGVAIMLGVAHFESSRHLTHVQAHLTC